MGFRNQISADRRQEKGKNTVVKATPWDHDPSTDICPLPPDPHAPRGLGGGSGKPPSGPKASTDDR